MKRILTNIILVLTLALVPSAAFGSTAYAAGPSCGNANSPEGQVLQGVGQTGNDCDQAPITRAFRAIVNILGIVAGVIGIIMVIIGGVRYMLSGGESGKVSNAKNTLLYALIGLAIAAAAQFLVHFVLYQSTNVTKDPGHSLLNSPSTPSKRPGLT